MNKTHKAKVWATTLLVILLAGVFVAMFYAVNTKFPESKKIVHPYGRPFIYEGAKITVKGKKILDSGQFASDKELVHILNPDDTRSDLSDTKIAIVDLDFYNPANRPINVDLTAFHLESGSFSLQFDFPLMAYYNKCGMNLELNKYEHKVLKMPVPLNRASFSKSEWPHIQGKTFYIVYSLYPEKNIVELPPQ